MPKLANKQQCTGCTACYSSCPKNCITMQSDRYGFKFPIVDTEKCVNCKKCEGACPLIGKNVASKELLSVYAAYLQDDNVRMDSSSGGIFTEIATEILDRKGVVFGAVFDDEYGVEHVQISEKEDLSKLRGAKYAQSELGECFFEVQNKLNMGKDVLFVGLPCQVAGLKSFLKKDYPSLFTVDFVCHGVPSPLVWKNYVKYRAEKDNHGILPEKINLRSKSSGWSRYRYSNRYEYSSSQYYSVLNGDDLFMKLFVSNYINRSSCADCHFKGAKRVSDITLGDFWGIWDVAPDMDDDKGTSLILTHTKAGATMFEKISARLKFREMSLRQASVRNPSLLISSSAADDRELILDKCAEGKFDEAKQFLVQKSEQQVSKIGILRKTLSKLKKLVMLIKSK